MNNVPGQPVQIQLGVVPCYVLALLLTRIVPSMFATVSPPRLA